MQDYSWYIVGGLSLLVAETLLIFEMIWLRAKSKKVEHEEALSMESRKLIEAHEKERAWLARELHDDITQRLCLLLMNLENLKNDKTSVAQFREGIGKA